MTAPDPYLAACHDHPHPEWWWPERTPGHDNHGADAKALCAQCPLIRQCLEQSLERREEYGIRGGAGGQLRRWLLRAFRDGGETWEHAFEVHLARLDGEHIPLDINGPDATHGLPVTYARGCRCRPCCLAIADRSRVVELVGERCDAHRIATRQAGLVPAFLTRRAS